ncbi:MAG: ABC transporter permease [Myxococcota bacterium]
MILLEAIRQAFRTLRAHRLRTILTLFGVVWGTAAVVFLMSWGAGVRVMMEHGMTRTGNNMVQIWAGKIGEEFTPAVDRRNLWFTPADVDAVRARARIPDKVAGESQWWSPVSFRQKSLSVDVRGIEPDMIAIRGVGIAAGRGIRRSDLNGRRRVAILGARTKDTLLGPAGWLGSRIRIRGQPFEVVGILSPVGVQLSRDGDEIDDQIWIPMTALFAFGKRWDMDEDVVDNIFLRVPERSLLDPAQSEVRGILSERLRVPTTDTEAIGMFSPIAFLKHFNLGLLDSTMLILALTTLIIGGIGIMNMMIDAVHERRSEIGIRLAVGARRRDVIWQFFLESFTITALGGLIGLLTAIFSCWVLSLLQVPDLIPVPILQWDVVFLAFAVMISVGFAAGVVPAWRAAQVDPALTLRMD